MQTGKPVNHRKEILDYLTSRAIKIEQVKAERKTPDSL